MVGIHPPDLSHLEERCLVWTIHLETSFMLVASSFMLGGSLTMEYVALRPYEVASFSIDKIYETPFRAVPLSFIQLKLGIYC